jgi:predicted TIM-barrel fold metal-dependent hydrolase
MNHDNVVISLDGHTHAFLDLKPWMPKATHADFDSAMEEGRRTFLGGNRYWADLVFAGMEQAWQSANALVEVDTQRYHEVLSSEQRLKNIDADGVAAEMLIDGFGPNTTDPQLQHEIAQGFIRWFHDYTMPAPHRYTAALVVSLAAGMDTVVLEIETAHKNGIRAIHLPPRPQIADRRLPEFNDALYEPMWNALSERNMSAIWHASVGREKPHWRWRGAAPGWEALLMLDVETAHHETLKYLLLGGIPERHPGMNFGYIESGSNWIAPILKNLDRYSAAPTANPTHKLKMKPSEQWARQGFAAGPLDMSEVADRHSVGVANLAFGSDYIHTEGTWPTTRAHLAKLMDGVPPAEAHAIVAGNAARLFGFDLDRLAQTTAARDDWRHGAQTPRASSPPQTA